MRKNTLIYFLTIFIATNLFYHEYWGVNALLTAIAIVFAQSIRNTSHAARFDFIIAALLLLMNGVAVFTSNSYLSISLFFVCLFYLSSTQLEQKTSFITGLFQSTFSFFTGFYRSLSSITNIKGNEKDKNKLFVQILLYTIPAVVAIVFLKLYQHADQTFYEWTKFINLDWISWPFITTYAVICFLSFGLYYFKETEDLTKLDQALTNTIPTSYIDRVQSYLTLKVETKIALSILITVNFLLLIYNFIDLRFVSTELYSPTRSFHHSQMVHGGINSLITSIILVILIITFIFRGQINFSGKKLIHSLAYFWLIQNIIMVITTLLKNTSYIAYWGLTYKRIGVYIYLTLAFLGLIITIYKIARQKSFWFLIRRTSLSFLISFTLIGAINWDRLITQYNLTQLPHDKIDFSYISELGNEGIVGLIQYQITNNIKEDALVLNLENLYKRAEQKLQAKIEYSTWRSYNLRDQYIHAQMDNINATKNQ